MSVSELKVLDGVFNIDDTAGAVLHIHFAGTGQFSRLAAAKMKRVFPVPRRAAVCESVAAGFDAVAQILVARNAPKFDERLTFEWRGATRRAVILLDVFNR